MWSAILLVGISTFQSEPLPASFLGSWQGVMVWTSAGSKEPKKVPMQLRIAKTRFKRTYDYHLVYGDKGQDSRPYELKLVDAGKDHWQIDEKNGIVLDAYLLGDSLKSVFSVGGNQIVTNITPENGKLISEMVTFEEAVFNTSKTAGVKTFRIKSTQRAVLTRKKA